MNNTLRFGIVYVLFVLTALVISFRGDMTVPTNKPLTEFPQKINSWEVSQRSEFSDAVLAVLKPTDYLYRQYRDQSGKSVGLYIGYHGGGKGGGDIHSPKNCLPGGGWYEVSSRAGVLELSAGKLNLVRAVYQKGESKELFLYWFQVRDRSISDEYSLKLSAIVNSALHRRKDASFIRISLPVDNDIEVEIAKGEQFIRDVAPLLKEFLPQ